MNKILVKSHILYGSVRFIMDYDDTYKPLANDILAITGNNTTVKYNVESLLEKRELYSLVESSSNNLSLFKDWIYEIYEKLNPNSNTKVFKNEAELLSTVTLDDFAEIDIHPFSCNKMYEANKGKLERTPQYNAWWNNFPAENLIKFKDVDFNKPIFVWYYFKHIKSFDTENLLKPTSDKICDFLATDDKNFNIFRIKGEYVDKYNDGKIYVFIANIEEEEPF